MFLALYFRLELYQAPAPTADGDGVVDTVRFTPLNLDQEKDEAFLSGLDYLGDTFTFIKEGGEFDKQMWEFGVTVNKHMRVWSEGEDDDEEDDQQEEDEDVEVLDVDAQ